MFRVQRRLSLASLLFPLSLVLFLDGYVAAGDLATALQQRSDLQAAEIDLIEAEWELENWRHVQLEKLYRRGFASWLELRRHQLIVDSLTASLHSAREFQQFLAEVATARQTAGNDQFQVVLFRQVQSSHNFPFSICVKDDRHLAVYYRN